MIFSIQRCIEDYLVRRGMEDLDQYAVRLANLYDGRNITVSAEQFLRQMRRIRTVMFRNRADLNRDDFERDLLKRLDRKFQKKKNRETCVAFPGGVQNEHNRLSRKPRLIAHLLTEFKNAIEARAIDTFWESRTKDKLRSKPEKLGQALLAVFAKGVMGNNGLVLREMTSGIGFVDIAISFSTTPHLLELKMLKSTIVGVEQLATYMSTERRKRGWLVLFDVRRPNQKHPVDSKLTVPAGVIDVLIVDLNPTPPNKVASKS